jgi:hypothetical protein
MLGMEEPIELLDRILVQSHPHEAIRLPLHEALVIASLDERELGSLSDAIERVGVVRALEEQGLFARKVVVCQDEDATFTIVSKKVKEDRRISISTCRNSLLPTC